MAHAEPEVKKPEKKPEETSSEIDPHLKETLIFLGWLILIAFVIGFAFILVAYNQETALNFIKFLNILIVLLGLFIIFQLYQFYNHTIHFKHYSDKIGEWYAKKYKPEKLKVNVQSQNMERFEKAKMHIGSKYKEEWKIGIIELDNILRDLLKEKNYVGETVADLLNDGAKKGLQTIDIAWEAHKVRNRVVHEGTKYDFSQEEATRILRKYSSVFTELGI